MKSKIRVERFKDNNNELVYLIRAKDFTNYFVRNTGFKSCREKDSEFVCSLIDYFCACIKYYPDKNDIVLCNRYRNLVGDPNNDKPFNHLFDLIYEDRIYITETFSVISSFYHEVYKDEENINSMYDVYKELRYTENVCEDIKERVLIAIEIIIENSLYEEVDNIYEIDRELRIEEGE